MNDDRVIVIGPQSFDWDEIDAALFAAIMRVLVKYGYSQVGD